VLLFILIGTSACKELTEQEIRERNEARWERLPSETKREHRRRADFAIVFWFDHEGRFDSRSWFLREIKRSGNREVAFVISQAEAGDENTFHFWPSHISTRVLYTLNHLLHEEFDDWDTVPFSHPVTTEDLIEYWEEIWDLCISLDIVCPTGWLNRLSYPTYYTSLKLENAGDHMLDQVRFASGWHFYFRQSQWGSLLNNYLLHLESEEGLFTDIVFVHSEDEAENFGDDILVAWPYADSRRLAQINTIINEQNINLALFSLTRPVTLKDLVDNWESVNALAQSLGIGGRYLGE